MAAEPMADGVETGVALSLPFPAARENTGKKIFCGSSQAENSHAIIDLSTTRGKNRKLGREPAGKPENPVGSPFGIAGPLPRYQLLIDNFS
jgi:hypothetical protein